MKYLSVCSGIEAASKAWEPIGWKPVAFSEIEPFPSAVLKHHWPEVQNLGDMSKYEQWNIPSGTVDLLVGGTPCQSFSVAGLRQGLKDPRGNLMLTYLAIAERLKPRWLVWENVPGVLSSNGGKDFGSFLGALGELGYEWAYRVLDAQWFGVAQRRRRVFVVAHLGKGNLAAKVLFESESVRRDTPPSREAGKGITAHAETSTRSSKEIGAFRMQAFGEYSDDGSASTMKARDYKDATDLVASPIVIDRAAFNQGQNAQYKPRIEHGETMDSLVARGPHAVAFQTSELRLTGKLTEKSVCPTLKANTKAGDTEVKVVLYENHPNDSRVTGPLEVAPSCVSRYGTGGGNVPLVQEAIAFEPGIATREGNESRFVKELSPTLRKEMGDNQVAVAVAIPIHDQATRNAGKRGDKQDGKGNGLGIGKPNDPAPTLTKGDKHAVAFAFDSLSSNSMKSKNPISGCNQVDLSKTLDTSRGLDPSCNQGGIAVLYENHPNDSRVTGPHDVAPSCVSRYGTGGGNVPLVQEGVDLYNQALTGDVHCPLRTAGGHGAPAALVQEAIAFTTEQTPKFSSDRALTITKQSPSGGGQPQCVMASMAVRRLSPRECERLQGFPDDHTMIPWRNKPADQCPDGPRYKALGNSMAVPCMAWIGKRIDAVERITK